MFRFFLAIFLSLPALTVVAQSFTVSGSVRESKSNQNLSGANVKILRFASPAGFTSEDGRTTVTDDFGAFVFRKVPPGTYLIEVSFVGYTTKGESVTIASDYTHDVTLDESQQMTDEVIVYATRANDDTPTAFTTVNAQTLQQQNFGQDLPFLLNWTPSLVTTSDAGAGVGYTGIRIRGSDATRINVTINGIPYNDSESQGTFWVNIPDIASSTQSVQIQRGVGTSSNGAGSFGGSVNLQTLSLQREPYAEVSIGEGSFNTFRATVNAGTGLINNRWSFDARRSRILSDGYIDRAESDLQSYYLSGGYYGNKTIIKAIVFGGGERTYQSWYGVDEATLKTNRTFNYAGALYNAKGDIYDYYENEVDDYKQDHYQLHFSQQLRANWNANVSFHYTYGRGFYEQYKQDESFTDLGLEPFNLDGAPVESGDVIVRRWLDNDFYGTTFSINHDREKMTFTLGGAYNEYANARHFGEIIWAEYDQNVNTPHVYYDGESEKADFNVYSKIHYDFTDALAGFADLQYRKVSYETAGVDNDQNAYSVTDEFDFFNPKFGLSYKLTEANILYASYAIANREPNRNDYLDGLTRPTSETLRDLELGWRTSGKRFGFEANYYYMNYINQLVLTGALDDVGNPIRSNVGKSYRSGVELSGVIELTKNFTWKANTTLSINKNKDYILDESDLSSKKNTTIVLSPSVVAASQLNWRQDGFNVMLSSKYVGTQYLDNTENKDRKLDSYLINDLRLGYSFGIWKIKEAEISAQINNLLDVEYESNGAAFGEYVVYFPQAGRNLMVMMRLKI